MTKLQISPKRTSVDRRTSMASTISSRGKFVTQNELFEKL